MSLLRSVLTIAAALSIAQAVVKLSELLLDSRQQQAFQHKVDTLALRLIDLNPIRHYHRMSERRVQIVWLSVSVLISWIWWIVLGSLYPRPPLDWRAKALLLATPFVAYYPFRLVVSWLAKSLTAGRMLLKAWGVFLLLLASVLAVQQYDEQQNIDDPWQIFVPLGFFMSIFFYAGLCVALVYTAQGFVWFFRHVLWRVATYSRGAWSAVILVLACVLGIAAALLPKR